MLQSHYIVVGLSLWLWALFVLFIAVNSGISAPFQMAFMAKTRMPMTIDSKSLACIPHTYLSQTLCFPPVCLWVVCRVVVLSVNCSIKGIHSLFCFLFCYVLYSGIYLWSLNCGSKDIEVKTFWRPVDPDFCICVASSFVFFDLDLKLEFGISIWPVIQEDQLAVWRGTPLCNAITEYAKSTGFIWQTWCDVESAQSTFSRQFLSHFLTLHICGWAE